MDTLTKISPLSEAWHKHFYHLRNWRSDLHYCGVPILKNPCDLFLIQELIWETKPDTIIECGTAFGGSALYYAHIMDRVLKGRVVTIDNRSKEYVPQKWSYPNHYRIHYLVGDSVGADTFAAALELSKGQSTMVILDSSHKKEHVSKELTLYAPYVSQGYYLIIEDTNTSLVLEEYGEGAGEAVDEFMRGNADFERVLELENKFGFSFNRYLKRVK